MHKHEKYGDVYTLNGSPADAVLIAKYYNRFEDKRPNLVLSGINQGDNAGLEPLLSSGTIGACWEALLHGIPSIAFSVHHGRSQKADLNYLQKATDEVLKRLIPKLQSDVIYNVNFPAGDKYNKIVFTNKIEKNRFNVRIVERKDPNGKPYLWIYGDDSNLKLEPGSDYYEIIKNKNIAITEISLNIKKLELL